MAIVQITEFTDPGCPFAWSAEPSRRKLQWLYGEQIRWRPRMVVLANLVPGSERRAPPASVLEVLEWAGEPLATREVAVVCDIGHDEAREQLGRVASERHLGFDGLWSAA